MSPISVMPMRSGVSAAFQYGSGMMLKSCRYQVISKLTDEAGDHIGNSLACGRIAQICQQCVVVGRVDFYEETSLDARCAIFLPGMVVSGSIQSEKPKPSACNASPSGRMPLG